MERIIPQSCPLTSTHVLWYAITHTCKCAHKHIKCSMYKHMEREQEKRIVTEEDTPWQPLHPQVHEYTCAYMYTYAKK